VTEIRQSEFQAENLDRGSATRRRARRTPSGRAPPGRPEGSAGAAGASLALHNLRGVAIAFVLMVHAFAAYLASVHSNGYAFDQPPYRWQAVPVLDRSRWLGFDVFCGWQDVYLMSLMFFLSGVFAWPSLDRNGGRRFLARRFVKLGGSFLFGVAIVMPVALYPVYRLSAADPSLTGYVRAYRALPFTPDGPMWFLCALVVFDAVAAFLHRWAARAVEAAGSFADSFESRPFVAFGAVATVAIAAYAALAMAFTPWRWINVGPLAIQLCRPLLYAVYFLLGLVVGRRGLGRGMLKADGLLARRWRALLGLAAAALVLWMALVWLSLEPHGDAPAALQILTDASYAVAGLLGVLFALAAAFRFGAVRRPLVGAVADRALPLYLLHYAPVVWMQYGLLDLPLPAVVKGPIAFAGALAITWCLAAGAEAPAIFQGRRARTRAPNEEACSVRAPIIAATGTSSTSSGPSSGG